MNAEELLGQAHSFFNEEDWERGAELLRDHIEDFGDDPALHCWLGVAEALCAVMRHRQLRITARIRAPWQKHWCTSAWTMNLLLGWVPGRWLCGWIIATLSCPRCAVAPG